MSGLDFKELTDDEIRLDYEISVKDASHRCWRSGTDFAALETRASANVLTLRDQSKNLFRISLSLADTRMLPLKSVLV